jgi:hypothetical protein
VGASHTPGAQERRYSEWAEAGAQGQSDQVRGHGGLGGSHGERHSDLASTRAKGQSDQDQ